jgi:DNA invertase Pin-like site-specific DNA recombinase
MVSERRNAPTSATRIGGVTSLPQVDLPPATGQLVGYIRVSTDHQTHDAQRDALHALGVSRIFADKMSGARDYRTGYRALLDYIRPGDTIVVTALDRLGRSLTSIVNTVSDLGKRGIYVRTLRESIDTSTSVGRMLAGLFASLAEYERELIAERARVARQAAAARGKLPGRPRKLPADKVALALRMRAAGESAPTIAQALGVSRATLYRALERVSA